MKLFYPKMSNKNICPNVVIYNALIDCFSKGGKLDEARKFFHLKWMTITYALMLLHTVLLLRVSVRKESWRRL
jgi:pentatricopeptide repeat protein